MTGARGIYELLVDLRLLRADPPLARKFHDFAFVARFTAAKKYAETLSANPSVPPPTRSKRPDPRIQLVADPANVKKFEDLCLKNWGKGSSGKPIAPDHWSGLSMAARAQKLGAKEHVRYRHVYAQFSWFVHPGSAAISGISQKGLTAGFTWAHGMVHETFAEATELICESQKIFEADPTLRHQFALAKVHSGWAFKHS